MKFFNLNQFDKSQVRLGFGIFILAACIILFEKIIGHLPELSTGLQSRMDMVLRLLSPFLIGFAFAYLMNPLTRFFENKCLKYVPFLNKYRALTRCLCILLNYILIFGGVIWILIYLLPEFTASLLAFINQLPAYSQQLSATVETLMAQVEFLNSKDVITLLNDAFAPLLASMEDLPKLLSDILGNIYSVSKKAFDLIMAIFISFYMLFEKEKFSDQIHRAIYSLMPERRADRFFFNVNRINQTFQDFIVGKALDSFIIGILAFIGFTALKAPFPLVLSLIVGVTNMIPYFGPFIGAIPAILITLLVNPALALWVALFILVLQQFDGNFLGPKILGDSLDLSPLWIILGVLAGGFLLGPLGMFVGVPIVATIKIFCSEFITKKYDEKYMDAPPEYLKNRNSENV